MTRIRQTTRTDILGLRILAGEERRKVRDHVALHRAEFEAAYEGKKLAPFDRSYIWPVATGYLADTNVSVTDGFVRECQRVLPWAKRIVAEASTAGAVR